MGERAERSGGVRGFHPWRTDRLLAALRAGSVGRGALALYVTLFATGLTWAVVSVARSVAIEGAGSVLEHPVDFLWFGVLASCGWTLRRSSARIFESVAAIYTLAVVRMWVLWIGAVALLAIPLTLGFELAGSMGQFEWILTPFILVAAALTMCGFGLPVLWMRWISRSLADPATPPFRLERLWRITGRFALACTIVGPLVLLSDLAIVELAWRSAERRFESAVAPLDPGPPSGLLPEAEPEDADETRVSASDSLQLSEDEYAFLRQTLRDPTWHRSALHRDWVREAAERNAGVAHQLAIGLAAPTGAPTIDLEDVVSRRVVPRLDLLLRAGAESAYLRGDDAAWRAAVHSTFRLADTLERQPGALGLRLGTRIELAGLTQLRRALADGRLDDVRPEILPTANLDDALTRAMAADTAEWTDIFGERDGARFAHLEPGFERHVGVAFWRWLTRRTLADHLTFTVAWHRALQAPYVEAIVNPPPVPRRVFSWIPTESPGWSLSACRARAIEALRPLAALALELDDDESGARVQALERAITDGTGPRFLPFADVPIQLERRGETGLVLYVEGVGIALNDYCRFGLDAGHAMPLHWEVPRTHD